MFEIMKRALTAGAVIAAVGALSAGPASAADAGARGVARVPTGASVPNVGICARHAGRCVSPTHGPIGPPVAGVGICARHAGRCLPPTDTQADTSDPRPPPATATSPDGFQWDDAGLGAAGMLLLLSAGGAATIVARRPHHRATTH